MSVYAQKPGVLDLDGIAGDEFTFTASFDVDLTGYTVTVGFYKVSDGTSILTPTPEVTPGTSSTVRITLTEANTAALFAAMSPVAGVARQRVRWFLRWVSPTGYTRTVLSGNVFLGVS